MLTSGPCWNWVIHKNKWNWRKQLRQRAPIYIHWKTISSQSTRTKKKDQWWVMLFAGNFFYSFLNFSVLKNKNLKNYFSQDDKAQRLFQVTGAPKFESLANSLTNLNNDENKRVDCAVSGFPLPVISWRFQAIDKDVSYRTFLYLFRFWRHLSL